MNQTKTPQQIAAYIRAIIKREVGPIETTERNYSESYNKHKAWRYKYYSIYTSKENMGRAYEAYKLVNGMAPKLKEMFGYGVTAKFSNWLNGDPDSGVSSLIINVTPSK